MTILRSEPFTVQTVAGWQTIPSPQEASGSTPWTLSIWDLHAAYGPPSTVATDYQPADALGDDLIASGDATYDALTGVLSGTVDPAGRRIELVESADADWLRRSSQPGVVWAHDFRSDAEVDNFRWTGGYGGGNDPLDNGPLPGTLYRNTADGVTGGGCLESQRPAGDSETPNWLRPFSPMTSPGNGLAADDPGANGTLTPQAYTPTDGGNELRNWQVTNPAWYGHPSYHAGNPFVNDEFYIQMRFKMDPRRASAGNDDVGKAMILSMTYFAQVAQELVVYSGGNTIPDGPNYHRMYLTAAFLPAEQLDSLGRPGQQVGKDGSVYPGGPYCDVNSQPGNCWAYSGGWDTLLYRMVPGRDNVEETLLQVWAASEGETTYTKLWDMIYTNTYQGPTGGVEAYQNGYCAAWFNTFQNAETQATQYWHRYDQIIFSHDFIECPQA